MEGKKNGTRKSSQAGLEPATLEVESTETRLAPTVRGGRGYRSERKDNALPLSYRDCRAQGTLAAT